MKRNRHVTSQIKDYPPMIRVIIQGQTDMGVDHIYRHMIGYHNRPEVLLEMLEHTNHVMDQQMKQIR